MRVLLVAHGYPPAGSGGTEIYTASLAAALHREFADEVFVLAREADPDRPEYDIRTVQRDGVSVTFVNNTFARSTSFEMTYRNPIIGDIAARVIEEVRPDVAHLQHLTCLSTEIPEILARRRIPVFFTLNDYWLLCHRGQLFDIDNRRCNGPSEAACARCIAPHAGHGAAAYRTAGLLRRLETWLPKGPFQGLGNAVRKAAAPVRSSSRAEEEARRRALHMRGVSDNVTLFLTPSGTLRNRFLAAGFPGGKLRPTVQGVDLSLLDSVSRPASKRLRIGFLGSLIVSKAPDVLLRAFRTLPADRAELHIWGDIAPYHGDDAYRRVIEPLLETPGISRHIFTPHDEIGHIFSAIDVLVIPSVWIENAPFVIREAFAAGVPVVASDLGGMAEMVEDGVSGLLFAAGRPTDLARVLGRLITEDDLLESLRRNLPSMKSIEQDAAELRELYAGAIAAEPGPRPRLAAVVLNYRTPRDAVLAVRSLQSSRRTVDEIIVVDNGSGDDSVVLLSRLDGITLIRIEENLGFSGGSNVGIRAALENHADMVFLLNADALVTRNTLGEMEETLLRHPEAGIAGPVVLHRHRPCCVSSAGIHFSAVTGRIKLRASNASWKPGAVNSREVSCVSGCAMLVKREVFEGIGLLDEDYFFSFEEIAFCLQASRAGHASIVVGDTVAYHAGSAAIGPENPDRLYYAARNHLHCARRAAPVPFPLNIARTKVIIALNLAHGLRRPNRIGALGAVLQGVWADVFERVGPR